MTFIFINNKGDKITLNSNDSIQRLFIEQCIKMGGWRAYLEKDGDVKALNYEEVLARI